MLFLVIVVGYASTLNGWYSSSGSTSTVDTSVLNITGYQSVLANWANQTASLVGNSQAVPFFGTGYVLAIGVYQAITLYSSIPTQVLVPLFQGIAVAFGLPVWFVEFAIVCILTYAVIELVNALKGGLL